MAARKRKGTRKTRTGGMKMVEGVSIKSAPASSGRVERCPSPLPVAVERCPAAPICGKGCSAAVERPPAPRKAPARSEKEYLRQKPGPLDRLYPGAEASALVKATAGWPLSKDGTRVLEMAFLTDNGKAILVTTGAGEQALVYLAPGGKKGDLVVAKRATGTLVLPPKAQRAEWHTRLHNPYLGFGIAELVSALGEKTEALRSPSKPAAPRRGSKAEVKERLPAKNDGQSARQAANLITSLEKRRFTLDGRFIDIKAFIHDNGFHQNPTEMRRIVALKPGQTVLYGGGAAPLFTLKRIDGTKGFKGQKHGA